MNNPPVYNPPVTNPEVQLDMLKFNSTRFGELEVSQDTIITIDQGLIGFSRFTKFVMLDYKEPFSWLHSVEEPGLAFVVIDGSAFGASYDPLVAFKDSDCDFKTDDEYAILLIVTFRNPREDSSVNTKAPLFINVRNRKGVQAVFDAPQYSTRWPLWSTSPQQSTTDTSQDNSPNP